MFEYFVFSMSCFFTIGSFYCYLDSCDTYEEPLTNTKEITIEDLKKRYGNDFIELCERRIYEKWHLHTIRTGEQCRLISGVEVNWEEMDESKKIHAVSRFLHKFVKIYVDDECQCFYLIPTVTSWGIFASFPIFYSTLDYHRERVGDECDN